MALLAAIALDFRHSQAVNANRGQRIANLVQLERLDNSHHDFHLMFPDFRLGRRNRKRIRRLGAARPTSLNQTPCHRAKPGKPLKNSEAGALMKQICAISQRTA
jgi:hypothetical protein